jgi:release factor glutamine methyltransferase
MGMTLKETQAGMAGRLASVPELRENASRDADVLIMHALGVERTELFVRPERVLTDDEVARIGECIDRRLAMEPVQYITGEQEFYGLPFKVTRATLIPRPETELLVETVLLRAVGVKRIVDVGTGSGAIAVALAHALPEASVEAVDLSEAALEVAKENAAANGVAVTFRLGDLLAGVEAGVDVVVSNPPYIPSGDRETMHPQVTSFEPSGALFAGTDGLEIYRRLIPQAREVLRPGGLLAMEIGFGQEEGLRDLMAGWDGVEFLEDLRGVRRVVVGTKHM